MLRFLRLLRESPTGGGGKRCQRRRLQRAPGTLRRADQWRDAAGGWAPESGAAETGPAAQNTEGIQQHPDIHLLQGR